MIDVNPGFLPTFWEATLQVALAQYFTQIIPAGDNVAAKHLVETPARVTRSMREMTRGYSLDPATYLQKEFARGEYDEMIHIRRIEVFSTCAHHMLPIIGRAHFAYLPDRYIVGLSKVPRMIDALSRRLQVQEDLTVQIVDLFNKVVEPKGCAVSVRAFHCCAMVRGVQEEILMDTTALRGCFRTGEPRQEFLGSIDKTERVFP